MTSKAKVEAVAEILARHILCEWTPTFLPKMRWPDHCSKAEQAKCRGVATMVINVLKQLDGLDAFTDEQVMAAALSDPDALPHREIEGVTRFEVIDETGRAYVRDGIAVRLMVQDENRTLKASVGTR